MCVIECVKSRLAKCPLAEYVKRPILAIDGRIAVLYSFLQQHDVVHPSAARIRAAWNYAVQSLNFYLNFLKCLIVY